MTSYNRKQNDVPSELLLAVEGLSVEFETPAGIARVVDDVSLAISPGSTLGVVGESGSGKSVLARAVMNLLAPSARVVPGGQVTFRDRDLQTLRPSEWRQTWGSQIAMVFQDPMTSLTPVLTIGKQITQTLRVHRKMTRQQARGRAIELLGQVGIPEPQRRFDQYPHSLSGGMRQRVAIALALSCDPLLVIADEPTTALDVSVQRQILELLDDVQQESGMGMMLITHDLGVVATRTHEIAVMYAGKIVERGPTRSLFGASRHPYTAALLASIPRVSDPSHQRLSAIPGRPPTPTALGPGCRFAPRCALAQPRCVSEAPELTASVDGHAWACHYPTGTEAGMWAKEANAMRGTTATGTPLPTLGVHDGR